jgi:hypothetical protein
MFKGILNTARTNFEAHKREEEIRHLDIDPEEYVMLRDDKSPIAVELLSAILEKLKLTNWEVDEGTLRIVRISESPSVRKNWSLAMTSDTRRFHLKVYRDFEGELDEIDLASSRGICAAIRFVEQTIVEIRERKVREEEMRRLIALEEEHRRREEELAKINAKIKQINEDCKASYMKEISAFKLGEELLSSAINYISLKVSKLDQTEIIMPVEVENEEINHRFNENKYGILDFVPCKLEEENSSISISNAFINHCINPENLVRPKCITVEYIADTRTLVVSDLDQEVPAPIDPTPLINRSWSATLSLKRDQSLRRYQYDGLSPRATRNLVDPLSEVEKILIEAERLSSSTKGDLARVSILGINTETTNLKDLIKVIDDVLSKISENVNLLLWNKKNASN